MELFQRILGVGLALVGLGAALAVGALANMHPSPPEGHSTFLHAIGFAGFGPWICVGAYLAWGKWRPAGSARKPVLIGMAMCALLPFIAMGFALDSVGRDEVELVVLAFLPASLALMVLFASGTRGKGT